MNIFQLASKSKKNCIVGTSDFIVLMVDINITSCKGGEGCLKSEDNEQCLSQCNNQKNIDNILS